MKKAFFALLFLLLFFFCFPQSSLADSNFSTDYNVTYTVNANSTTQVNLNVVLTNLTSKYYASSYSIQVGFQDIKNLTAYDSLGAITPKITKTSKGTTISLDFNKSNVGENNKLNFGISFDTSEIAQKFNNIWDINIPGVATQNDFSSFNVSVIYPPFLGNPTFIKPLLLDQTASRSANKLFFTKQDLGDSGISIAFGNFQVYDLNLTYHLENKNLFPISTEIALPPTTNYQDISIENIIPAPLNVKIDKDGNWLAQYILPTSKSLNITVKGKAKVYLSPKPENLDSSLLQDYLKPQPYWDTHSVKIENLAKDLKTPYAIYQYVVKALNYDFSRVETNGPRLGGLNALNNPNSAVCLEFTDLFVTLARAAGIPAREINGYGYTNNSKTRPLSFIKDILHAWPEYYDFDKRTWVMVDPTWGNTTGGVDYFNTLDFDHIAFTINGEDSSYPVPAGGYKTSENQDTKDVNIQIGKEFDQNSTKLTSDFLGDGSVIAGVPFKGFIKVSNFGREIIQKQQVDVKTNYLLPKDQVAIIEAIPPYGYTLIPINFKSTPLLTNNSDTIKITVGNYITYKNVKISPFFVNKMFLLGGLVIVNFIIIISLIAYLYRRLSLYRRTR
jgi:hypothetical protein